ncbi:MAG: ATP-binding protein, partial [Prolixibacteraceae bacterium]
GITNGMIGIGVSADGTQLAASLTDTAPPFNPLEFMVPGGDVLSRPLEQRPIGGLGIMLARENVDEYRYQYLNGKNINILVMNVG